MPYPRQFAARAIRVVESIQHGSDWVQLVIAVLSTCNNPAHNHPLQKLLACGVREFSLRCIVSGIRDRGSRRDTISVIGRNRHEGNTGTRWRTVPRNTSLTDNDAGIIDLLGRLQVKRRVTQQQAVQVCELPILPDEGVLVAVCIDRRAYNLASIVNTQGFADGISRKRAEGPGCRGSGESREKHESSDWHHARSPGRSEKPTT